MRKALILFVFILGLGVFYSNHLLKESSTLLHSWVTGYEIRESDLGMDDKELWIEVHDVSPTYLSKLEEVVQVLEKHPRAYSKVVLFIIPNHGGDTPLQEYPEFVNKLQILERKGFILGLHGYTHKDPTVKPEFKTSRAEAEKLLQTAEKEFAASGLKLPTYFLPPGWRTTREVDDLLMEMFELVYYYYYVDTPYGIYPSQTHEYVWYNHNYKALERAQRDYTNLNGVIRLTIHLGAINTTKGLTFLHQYLRWIEEKE